MQVEIKDYEDFRSPNRKPWLLLLGLLVLGGIVLWKRLPREDTVAPDMVTQGEEAVEQGAGDVRDKAKPETGSGPSVVELPSDLSAALGRAVQMEREDELDYARQAYLEILRRNPPMNVVRGVEESLGRVNIALVTTPRPMSLKKEHLVSVGDSIQKIALRYGTTVELVQKSNDVKNPNIIKTGYRFRVLVGNFSIKVSRSANTLVLFLNGEFFKRYAVGTGKFNRTPIGTFKLVEKIKHPDWWRPDGSVVPYNGDPSGENILGTHWMSLRATGDTPDVRGYGIHGTWDDASIGKSESAGCIRLRNRDVEELFMLVPEGTPVTIEE